MITVCSDQVTIIQGALSVMQKRNLYLNMLSIIVMDEVDREEGPLGYTG